MNFIPNINTPLKVGDKVRVTSRMSRNYDKIGVVVAITSYSVRIKAIEDRFFTMNDNCVDEVDFTGDRVSWLSLEFDNTVSMAAWCRKSVSVNEKSGKETAPFSFEEVAQKNKEKEERIKQDRARANNGITRSYGLKR